MSSLFPASLLTPPKVKQLVGSLFGSWLSCCMLAGITHPQMSMPTILAVARLWSISRSLQQEAALQQGLNLLPQAWCLIQPYYRHSLCTGGALTAFLEKVKMETSLEVLLQLQGIVETIKTTMFPVQ